MLDYFIKCHIKVSGEIDAHLQIVEKKIVAEARDLLEELLVTVAKSRTRLAMKFGKGHKSKAGAATPKAKPEAAKPKARPIVGVKKATKPKAKGEGPPQIIELA